jgi:hypothetical protein
VTSSHANHLPPLLLLQPKLTNITVPAALTAATIAEASCTVVPQ